MGHVVTIGAAGIVPPQGPVLSQLPEWGRMVKGVVKGGVFHPFALIEQNRGISGVQILLLWDQLAYLQGVSKQLMALYSQGVIAPYVDRVFSMDDVAGAHDYMESRRSRGKLLLATHAH